MLIVQDNKPIRQKRDFLVFGNPDIGEDEIQEVIHCLKSGWIGTGPKVKRFEEDFCQYKNAGNAVAVNSCTAALHLSILAAGIKPGDEVITTAMTFCATINAIIHSGAKPVLVDCEPHTFCIDAQKIENVISSKTKAIVPVHFAGYPCDMDTIMAVANKHKLKVIEDCAHAIETKYKDKHVGTFGDFGCFSFYVTKNVVTGEGGMILTKSKDDMDKIKVLALHGMSQDAWQRFSDDGYKHYQVVQAGFKYNMMDLQAALGIHQLKKIEISWNRRREIWQKYQDAFRDSSMVLPSNIILDIKHGYHLFTMLIDEKTVGISRDKFLESMNNENVGTGVHYLSIPTHPFYQKTFGWNPKDFPESYRIGQQTVSIPLSPKLNDDDVQDVIKAVRKIIE